MGPFVVDIYSLDSKDDIRKRRLEKESLESALKEFEVFGGYSDVFRIVLYRRLGGGGMSKMKVWARNGAAS